MVFRNTISGGWNALVDNFVIGTTWSDAVPARLAGWTAPLMGSGISGAAPSAANGTPNLAAQLPEFNSVAFYSGSAGTNSLLPATGVPNDGANYFACSVIGTPFDGGPRIIVGRTVRFGEAIANIVSLAMSPRCDPRFVGWA